MLSKAVGPPDSLFRDFGNPGLSGVISAVNQWRDLRIVIFGDAMASVKTACMPVRGVVIGLALRETQ